jgi:hypothetical protein
MGLSKNAKLYTDSRAIKISSKFDPKIIDRCICSVIGQSDFNNFNFFFKLTTLFYQKVELQAEFKAVKQNSPKKL